MGEGQDRLRFEVHGVVQGVGFRMWVLRQALELELRGTVRNRRDGAVEIEAAGPPADLERFEQRLARGPRMARVDAVRRISPGSSPLPDTFEITP